ncbi:MAG: hypothetical protein EOO75_18340 [Myxococcales bacterium]|nr:MAG: hypothetical protein EOO75_18340 [Myxococcales bacterium]
MAPPTIEPGELTAALHERGFGVLAPDGLRALLGGASLAALESTWDNLPLDPYLRDGGHYRFRRHGCFVVELPGGEVTPVPHRAHFQPVEYNALHGGIERWFEPLEPVVSQDPAFRALLGALGRSFAAGRPGEPRWFVEAHQFRIDTADGIGRPTPEGAHRDGVDFVAVALVSRAGIKGGETRVFDAAGPSGLRFTMAEPWTTLLLDDERFIHESTPIQPTAPGGHRDTLVLTFRAGGFQAPLP